jgi:hypothetical protein
MQKFLDVFKVTENELSNVRFDELDGELAKIYADIVKQQTEVNNLTAKYRELTGSETITTIDEMKEKFVALQETLFSLSDEYDELSKREEELTKKQDLTDIEKEELSGIVDRLDVLDKELETTTTQSDELGTKLRDMELNPNLVNDMVVTEQKITDTNNKISDLKDRFVELYYAEDSSAEAVVETQDKANSKLSLGTRIVNKLTNAFNNLKSAQKSARKETNLIDATIGKLSKKLFGMVKRVFVFSVITKALRALKSSLSSLFSADPEMQSYFSSIKANLLTAFAPIYEYIMPAFKQLLTMLKTASAYLAQFTSALFGKTIKQSQDTAKALEQQANATNDLTDATEAANNALGHLDELNTDIQLSSGDTSATDSTSGLTYEDIQMNEQLLRIVEKLKNAFKDLFTPLKNSWAKNGETVLSSAQYMMESLLGMVSAIGGSWARVWENGSGELLLDTIFGILSDIFQIVGNVANQFTIAWTNAGLGDEIFQHLFNLAIILLGYIQNIIDGLVTWSSEIDFTPLLKGIDAVLEACEPLAEDIGSGLQWFFENVLEPFATWAIENAIPAALDLISSALGVLDSAIEALKPYGQWLWDEFLQPLAQWAGENFINLLQEVKIHLDAIGMWIDDNHESITQFLQLVTLIGGAFLIVSNMGTAVALVLGVVGKVIAAVSGFILSPLGLIAALAALIVYGGNGEEVIGDLKSALGDILAFIKDVFAGDWEAAWNDLGNFFIDIGNSIIAAYESIVNGIIKALNQIQIDMNIPDWVPGVGGKNFKLGVNLATLELPRIPALATGTVVPAGSSEFLAKLGDNKQETEIVSPLSTMKQALLEALQEYGGTAEDQQIVLEIDGDVLFRWLVKKNREKYLQTHQNQLVY